MASMHAGYLPKYAANSSAVIFSAGDTADFTISKLFMVF